MAKSGVDVRYSRTRPEWLVASLIPGSIGAIVWVVFGFVASSVLRGVGNLGFFHASLSMRPVYLGGTAVFAVVTCVAVVLLRPKLVSGGSGAGGNGPARHARVWAGPDTPHDVGVDGPASGAAVTPLVRPV